MKSFSVSETLVKRCESCTVSMAPTGGFRLSELSRPPLDPPQLRTAFTLYDVEVNSLG
jgi:hypothetical protein